MKHLGNCKDCNGLYKLVPSGRCDTCFRARLRINEDKKAIEAYKIAMKIKEESLKVRGQNVTRFISNTDLGYNRNMEN